MSNRLFNTKYLVGHWRLNSVTDDYSCRGNTLSFGGAGSEKYKINKFGKTTADLNFGSGENNFYSLSNEIDLGTNFTITFYAEPVTNRGTWDSFGGDKNDPGQHRVLIAKNGLFVQFDGQIEETPALTSKDSYIASIVITNGTDIEFYRDSELEHSGSYSTAITAAVINQFGEITRDGSVLGQILFHNVGLSADEVSELYKRLSVNPTHVPVKFAISQLPDKEDTSLVASYLNKKTAGTADDYSNSNYDGTSKGVIFLSDGGGRFSNSTQSIISRTGTSITGGNISIVMDCQGIGASGATNRLLTLLGASATEEIELIRRNSDSSLFVKINGNNAYVFFGELSGTGIDTIGFTYDGTEGFVYLNGIKSANPVTPRGAIANITEIHIGNNKVQTLGADANISMLDIYNRVLSESEMLFIARKRNPDPSLVLNTLITDDNDLSVNNVGITTTNAVLGKGGVFTSGSMAWAPQTFTTQAYTFRESNGALSRYLFNGVDTFKNGVSGAALPLTITATGFSGFTGELVNIKLWSRVIGEAEAKEDYLKERIYW
jgi:hypothetical protein